MTRLHLAGAACAALAVAALGACNPTTSGAPAKPAVDTSKIADAVKADADQLAADYSAHDVTKVMSHGASDMVAMGHGQPNDVGAAAREANLKKAFAAVPDAHVTLANETTDVAASGDMAVFHSTYVFTGTDPKTKKAVTENGNYLAGYKPQADGSWKQMWSVVSDTGPAPKAAPAAKS